MATQEETFENLLKEQEFLEKHGTDLKVRVKGNTYTLYFIGGNYNCDLFPSETEELIGVQKKGKLYVNSDFCVKIKYKGGEYEFSEKDAEIL